jgi:hypothetical protein
MGANLDEIHEGNYFRTCLDSIDTLQPDYGLDMAVMISLFILFWCLGMARDMQVYLRCKPFPPLF